MNKKAIFWVVVYGVSSSLSAMSTHDSSKIMRRKSSHDLVSLGGLDVDTPEISVGTSLVGTRSIDVSVSPSLASTRSVTPVSSCMSYPRGILRTHLLEHEVKKRRVQFSEKEQVNRYENDSSDESSDASDSTNSEQDDQFEETGSRDFIKNSLNAAAQEAKNMKSIEPLVVLVSCFEGFLREACKPEAEKIMVREYIAKINAEISSLEILFKREQEEDDELFEELLRSAQMSKDRIFFDDLLVKVEGNAQRTERVKAVMHASLKTGAATSSLAQTPKAPLIDGEAFDQAFAEALKSKDRGFLEGLKNSFFDVESEQYQRIERALEVLNCDTKGKKKVVHFQ